jgi:hypothetical protein
MPGSMEITPRPNWEDKGTYVEPRDDKSAKVPELLLTPKTSSTGAEGTMFYDSDDDHVYVATEV